MLQLLSPAGLWALAALALPLAIHLWRPPPKTVRLGSLRFLDNIPHRRLRQLRWRELALLAARLALLTALALLLTAPWWRPAALRGPQHWVLLDPTAAVTGDVDARLRQLRGSGYSVHALTPGFPLAPGETNPAAPPDLWSLLRAADAVLPAGSTLAVFTPGRLAALSGARPALRHCRVEWVRTPDVAGTSPRSWIESLQVSAAAAPAKARALVGTSGATATTFANVDLTAASGAPAVELAPDRASARLAPPNTEPPVRASAVRPPLHLLILHDADRAEDARNMTAAVRAVATLTGQPMEVTSRSRDEQKAIAGEATRDWIIWLSAQPVPAQGLPPTRNLLRDAATDTPAQPAIVEDWIVAPPGTPAATALGVAPVRLWRRTSPHTPTDREETLWLDGRGNPLLTLERDSQRQTWHFFSRFDPDWTDLPRSSALPAFIQDLLQPSAPDAPTDPAHDLRRADPSQYALALSPNVVPQGQPTALAQSPGTDLHWPLWILVAILFAAERFLSRAPSLRLPARTSASPAFAR